MSKEEYLKYLMDRDIDSLTEEEQQYFYDNITYEIIEDWIDDCMTAALIDDITYEPTMLKSEIHINDFLKDFENTN